MSLKGRIEQIARSAVKNYATAYGQLTQGQSAGATTSTSNVLMGSVVSTTGNFTGTQDYIIQFSDGSTQQCPPAGTKPLYVGSVVLVSNGMIVSS
jgi:hypothetical protein